MGRGSEWRWAQPGQIQLEPSGDPVADRAHVVEVPEASGPPPGLLDVAVYGLDHRRGQVAGIVAEDALQMAADGPAQPDEGGQGGSARPRAEVQQVAPGPWPRRHRRSARRPGGTPARP